MASGNFGIAIFPANENDPEINKVSKNSRIDHFAFNVSNEDLEKAKQHYEDIRIEFQFEDHFYTHSIYAKDPDGHVVELTTAIKRCEIFL
jgi:catechol-2,3-dioxygenase